MMEFNCFIMQVLFLGIIVIEAISARRDAFQVRENCGEELRDRRYCRGYPGMGDIDRFQGML
jgi:hypothetical protein